uniref:Uncharacterized protein n=1 Tax=Serinus canaria TaxID=9135 RepID=A0A8C9N4M7_SERCA
VLLVGCKTDLRQDQEVLQRLKDGRIEPVSRQQVGAMARQVRAVSYMECSARYQDNVGNIFVTACNAAISAARRRQRKAGPRRVCAIL